MGKKIVINVCFGGFDVPSGFCETYGLDKWSSWDIPRDDARLVEYVESHADENGQLAFGCSRLCVCEIPDNATDWRIQEYDGAEDVWCVVDGKIV